MMDILTSWWTVGGIAAFFVGAGALMLTPFGAPVLAVATAFLSTSLGRWIGGLALGVFALLAALSSAKQAGRNEASAELSKANSEAKQDRAAIEKQVAQATDDANRKELAKWVR